MLTSNPSVVPVSGTWKRNAEETLTRASLLALFANEIPAVRIPGFATTRECRAFTAAVRMAPIKYYNVAPPVGYIGMAQYEYRWDRPKADYFRDVVNANELLSMVTTASFDPLARMIGHLDSLWSDSVGVAHEPGHGPYYAGIVRVASGGIKLHADFAPFNSPSYAIGAIDAQLGWNFFAEQPAAGGETTVHNLPWTPVIVGDEIPVSYDLPRIMVEGATTYRYAPTAGDVVIFNSRNPHEVASGAGGEGIDRVSIGSFIGRLPDGSLGLWS